MRKPVLLFLDMADQDRREQVSPLTGIVREVLKEIRAERGKVQSLTSRHVFTKNGRPINKTMIENAMASTLKRAKIENFCFHDLRHCAKTSWARRVIPAEVAMKAAGHKSWQMHARIFTSRKSTWRPCSIVPRASPRNPAHPIQPW